MEFVFCNIWKITLTENSLYRVSQKYLHVYTTDIKSSKSQWTFFSVKIGKITVCPRSMLTAKLIYWVSQNYLLACSFKYNNVHIQDYIKSYYAYSMFRSLVYLPFLRFLEYLAKLDTFTLIKAEQNWWIWTFEKKHLYSGLEQIGTQTLLKRNKTLKFGKKGAFVFYFGTNWNTYTLQTGTKLYRLEQKERLHKQFGTISKFHS